MELKTYQKQVIRDLTRYLELMNEKRSYIAAFSAFWREKRAPVLGRYQDILPGVPNLCFKVPTGGGKTFLACSAIRPVFDALPVTKAKVVVWLAPSDAILAQIADSLKDAAHPYRQRIDRDFGGNVEVYTKQELLAGKNFSMTTVSEQLSIMVLSYDSFRGRSREALKAYQQNSSLADMAKALGKPEQPIERADDTALFQIINQLSPLVIVDESHHARSELSLDMLTNFNPCFVLELTATPRQYSNILSYVDALQLKRANMVKLPVIVYNRSSQQEVVTDAIDLRCRLEEIARQEQQKSKKYIRPIVLFQAQPRGREDSTTFEKLRAKLVQEADVPADQIAIRTADVNELKNVNLMSEDCPIRYIITVNALKEGWDCPFAYILASLANRTSPVDVEQIVGRVLRLPHTCQHGQMSLNMSYVITSFADFDGTVRRIVAGLNNAGFTSKDCRVAAPPEEPKEPEEPPCQEEIETPAETGGEGFLDFDGRQVARELESRRSGAASPRPERMLEQAEQAGSAYSAAAEQAASDPFLGEYAWEVRDKIAAFQVKPEFREDIHSLLIPQFFQTIPQSFFSGGFALLEKEQLGEDFTLRGKAYDIDFTGADDEIAKVDVRPSDGGLPKVFKMSEADQRYFKEHFNTRPQEVRQRQCVDIIFHHLNKLDMVDAGDLRAYLGRIVGDMSRDQLAAMEKAPLGCAAKIRSKIEELLTRHCKETFFRWLETERIVCRPSYRLPPSIHPSSSNSMIGGALYEAEESMNDLERTLVLELTALPNVRWWHRNISRQGFCINGYINHYTDIILQTEGGRIILAETKGEHLKNDGSLERIALGQAWRTAAGGQYRYYMVFRDGVEPLPGAVSMSRFLELVKEL